MTNEVPKQSKNDVRDRLDRLIRDIDERCSKMPLPDQLAWNAEKQILRGAASNSERLPPLPPREGPRALTRLGTLAVQIAQLAPIDRIGTQFCYHARLDYAVKIHNELKALGYDKYGRPRGPSNGTPGL